jgi:hypothetical protein
MCSDFNGDGCLESKIVACKFGEWCQSPTGCVPMPCTEEWYCDDWGACANGVQTRKCVEANACGTEELKPEFTQTCVITETPAPVEATPITVEEHPQKKPLLTENQTRIVLALLLVGGLVGFYAGSYIHRHHKHK